MPRRWEIFCLFAIAVSLLGLLAKLTEVRPLNAAEEPPAKPATEKAADSADPLKFRPIAGLLEKHCSTCHGTTTQESGVSFAGLGDAAGDVRAILGKREIWLKAKSALKHEEMPPDPDDTKFTATDRAALLKWIEERIEKIDRADPIYLDPGPTLLRQFTRQEYTRTIRDLMLIDFDPAAAAGIAEEQVVDGFSNLAGSQIVNEALMEKYFAAAEASLDYLFSKEPSRAGKLKRAREALLIALPGDKSPDKPGETLTPRDAAARVLERFVRRAYRRPIEKETLDRLLALFDRSTKAGDEFELAIRKCLKPVLVSPNFLFRLEGEVSNAKSPQPITDHELAVRLSYFLWSTMPDDTLFALADDGKLSQPAVLSAQVKRMLADNKARALTDYFAMQWLHLNQFDRILPNKNFFPQLTSQLKQAMEQETRQFFDALRLEDNRVLDLLDADYTYANDVLAKFYGIDGVQGQQFRKVPLKPEHHRGGLLGMSSILTLTSHVDRTKPTSRGKWILEVLLGTPPAPPPPDVSVLKTPKGKPEPRTFREKLALHASETSCAGCHKRIDPLGFALENYDAIGTWRDEVAGEPVDNKGQLAGGAEFRGPAGLKKVLAGRQDQFVRHFTAQMLSYALGRKTEYYDEAAIAGIVDELAKNDYRFSVLITEIVKSRPFTHKR